MLPYNKNNAWFLQRLIKQSQSFETSHATAKITKHTIKKTSNMTWKSLSSSLHKLLLVPLFCIKLFLFSNTIWIFYKHLFWWIPIKIRGKKNIPLWKDTTRSERKSRQKWKPKAVAEKEEYSMNNKSEKLSVLCKWKRVHLLQRKFVRVQTFIAANKTN
jgi:hypothetical protein